MINQNFSWMDTCGKRFIKFYIKGGARDSIMWIFGSILAPLSLHFISYNFQGFFSGYQTRLFEKWANEIYEKGDNLVKVREDNTFSTVIEKKSENCWKNIIQWWAEKAGVVTDSKMIAIRDRGRTDLVCRTENMSNCMESIKGTFQILSNVLSSNTLICLYLRQ